MSKNIWSIFSNGTIKMA